jgi:hypothetical protein
MQYEATGQRDPTWGVRTQLDSISQKYAAICKMIYHVRTLRESGPIFDLYRQSLPAEFHHSITMR